MSPASPTPPELADPLAPFHPLVRQWFTETLGAPSPPQRAGWPVIARGADTLILAPTGTGKTLAAFLWELDALITDGLTAPLANAVHLLYVSPLKALNNDVQRNLEKPLAELRARFEAAGEHFPRYPRWRAHWRHDRRRARADAAPHAAHSHHDARITAHTAHERSRSRHLQRTARGDCR